MKEERGGGNRTTQSDPNEVIRLPQKRTAFRIREKPIIGASSPRRFTQLWMILLIFIMFFMYMICTGARRRRHYVQGTDSTQR